MTRPVSVMVGLLLSLLLHVILLCLFPAPKAPVNEFARAPAMIWIRQVAPRPIVPAAVPVVATPAATAPSAARTVVAEEVARRTRAGRGPVLVPVPAARTEAARNVAAAVAPQPADPVAGPTAAETPRFNMDAARKAARKFAVTPAGKNDPAVAQLYDHPINAYPTETPLARAINGATRPDCKTFAQGTGIFAVIVIPYVILTDKKDSGCKW